MDTYINDILLDYSTAVPRTREFQITTESVQSTEFDDITRHVKRVLPEFSLTCAFTGENKETNFQSLLDLADNNTLITLSQYKIYENLIIKSIVETGKYEDVIEFQIVLKKINLVEFTTTSEPLPTAQASLQDTSKQGLQQTEEISGTFTPKVLSGTVE